MNSFKRLVFPAAVVAAAIALIAAARAGDPAASAKNAYVETDLVSDQSGAPNKDPNLKNAWGVAFSPDGSPFWIADNNSGKSTLYDGTGAIHKLVVTIPCPKKAGAGSGCPASAAPTGIVFNTGSGFIVPGTKSPAAFIFDTEDGTISAWNGTPKTKAVLVVDNATNPNATLGAVYKGLAIGVNESGQFLFATNFRAGKVEVYDQNFKPATTSGGFKDSGIPAGYAPFGIQNVDGNLLITFAQQNATKHDDVEGAGHGFVDAFDTDGHMLARLATRGGLNSPWGMARASYAFGPFSGDLLIGNFGNSWINALTPTGLVPLNGTNGMPLAVGGGRGLWTLTLGGGANSNPSTLYFTAGPNKEMDGRFGTITPAH
jgi:uncharacterized protein (TIGR03118 family)